MKKIFALVLSIVMLLSLVPSVFAANTLNGCKHPNMTTTVVSEQLPDCYHTLYRETLKTCPDCDYEEMFIEVGNEYQHGQIETTVVNTPATCVSNGWVTMSAVCKKCGQKVNSAIQPSEKVTHAVKIGEEYPDCYVIQEHSVAGNCDSYGFREKVLYCTDCDCVVKVLEHEQLPMSEHYWTDWEVKDGVEERHCISCGLIETRETNETHFNENVIAKILNYFKNLFETIKAFFARFNPAAIG